MQSETPQPPRRKRRALDWPTAILTAIVIASAAYVYWRDGLTQFLSVAWSDADMFAMTLPKILAGCLIATMATVLLPRDLVSRWVGAESGMRGILIATFAGMILPGGPYTIFPIATAFIAMGADVAAAVTLITSWMLIGINRAVVWELAFFGFDFVAWRYVGALPLPIIAGLLVRALMKFFKLQQSKNPT